MCHGRGLVLADQSGGAEVELSPPGNVRLRHPRSGSQTMQKLISGNKHLYALAVLLALVLASSAGFKWG